MVWVTSNKCSVSAGVELQNPFSPCLVTRHPKLYVWEMWSWHKQIISLLGYHKPHAALLSGPRSAFAFSRLHVYSHLSWWAITHKKQTLMWEQSNLQPWRGWSDGEPWSQLHWGLSHSSPHCPHFLSACKMKWAIGIVFQHRADVCVGIFLNQE